MKEKVGWGRTKNTGLNEAFFSQRTAAERQARNFFRPAKVLCQRSSQPDPAGVSGWKTAAVALLPGALPWFALLFEGVTTVLKAKKRPMPGMC
jgi:hypothetical protein